jgi:hypothetical protein
MKMTAKFIERYPLSIADYQALEGFNQHPRNSIWNQIGQTFRHWLNTSPEPRVRMKYHAGQTYWQVYDPTTQRSEQLATEQEVRVWLEQRYNV